MLQLTLGDSRQKLQTLLCLGAHCDDIEIACGGTVLRLAEENPDLQVYWVVLTSEPARAIEAKECASRFLAKVRWKEVIVKDFRTSFLPYMGTELKDFFEEVKATVNPDLILTHTTRDLHQDHRVICELTWNTYRNHFILEYEIPKYDGDLSAPNVFMPLEPVHYQAKIDHLMACFPTQSGKHWFAPETFLALMRLRGMECNSPSGYAEAFYCRKASLSPVGGGR